MKKSIDGKAIVYAEGAFNTTYGKTAHGLVRFTERYEIVGVIDHRYAGQDAGTVLDNSRCNIPIFKDLSEALENLGPDKKPETFIIGLATDGGLLPEDSRKVVRQALLKGMNIDSGLHDYIYKDPELMAIASKNKCRVRDIRKTKEREELHFFTGKIEEVDCLKIALLGTDSAVGKRTTAWIIVHAMRKAGYKAELVGTGQTAWMQGAKYSMIMDSCINDFVAGEIEHAVYEAWKCESPDIIVIEGQGSLMNPAYPGGFEILAAGRPDYVVLQHPPRRIEYDGFPGYPLHSLDKQIEAIELLSGRDVIAITINHEGMADSEIIAECKTIEDKIGLPTFDVLRYSPERLVELLSKMLK